jgi:hypothetical protein
MPTIHIRHPAKSQPFARPLEPGEALLIGRSPDPSRVGISLDGWNAQTLTLDDDAVSSNHCLIWCAPEGLWVQDLQSRNGTWLRLSTHPVALAGAELRVDLAGLHEAPVTGDGPTARDAWTGRDDYGARVAEAIDTWLRELGVDVTATVVSRADVPRGLRFALAHGGTLFLDEVAELDARTQASLLRFLDQRGEYERLGDPRPRHADVRIVCATNRDLRAEVRAGRFRDDLWYRFAAAVVDVPPLRERPEDVRAFLAARRVSRTLTAWEALSPDARSFATSHSWPGNFRELANFIERLPAVTRPGAIDAATCQRALQEGLVEAPPPPTSAPSSPAPWDGLLAEAASSWREDHQGSDPETLGDIRDFVESYLKPVFAARASGVAQGVAVSDLNWSALGRRLAVADGTTVKRWVERYLARFRRG